MNIDSYTNKFSKIKFAIFREDVLDCFHSIIKSIEDENIQTNFNYNELMDDLLNDFKLYNIVKFINELSKDNEFKKHKNAYKIALTYCNEIMENDIINDSLNYSSNYSNKEKVE
jgi:hypothetical protein